MRKSIKIMSVILIATIMSFYGCSSKKSTENLSIEKKETSNTASEKLDSSSQDEISSETSVSVANSKSDITSTENETNNSVELSSDKEIELISDTISSTVTETKQNPTDAETSDNKPVTIDIVADDGSIQELSYHSSGEININRPSSLKGTEVFIGWEENDILSQISDNSINIEEAISLNIESENISDTENAIFNDTIYTESNTEYVDIPVIIGGKTNFAVLDLEIAFDTNILAFESFNFIDSDAECNCTDDGKILISFVSTENITADVNLCSIKLKKLSTENIETRLNYSVKDIAAWNEDLTDYVDVTYRIVNDRIVMY